MISSHHNRLWDYLTPYWVKIRKKVHWIPLVTTGILLDSIPVEGSTGRPVSTRCPVQWMPPVDKIIVGPDTYWTPTGQILAFYQKNLLIFWWNLPESTGIILAEKRGSVKYSDFKELLDWTTIPFSDTEWLRADPQFFVCLAALLPGVEEAAQSNSTEKNGPSTESINLD